MIHESYMERILRLAVLEDWHMGSPEGSKVTPWATDDVPRYVADEKPPRRKRRGVNEELSPRVKKIFKIVGVLVGAAAAITLIILAIRALQKRAERMKSSDSDVGLRDDLAKKWAELGVALDRAWVDTKALWKELESDPNYAKSYGPDEFIQTRLNEAHKLLYPLRNSAMNMSSMVREGLDLKGRAYRYQYDLILGGVESFNTIVKHVNVMTNRPEGRATVDISGWPKPKFKGTGPERPWTLWPGARKVGTADVWSESMGQQEDLAPSGQDNLMRYTGNDQPVAPSMPYERKRVSRARRYSRPMGDMTRISEADGGDAAKLAEKAKADAAAARKRLIKILLWGAGIIAAILGTAYVVHRVRKYRFQKADPGRRVTPEEFKQVRTVFDKIKAEADGVHRELAAKHKDMMDKAEKLANAGDYAGSNQIYAEMKGLSQARGAAEWVSRYAGEEIDDLPHWGGDLWYLQDVLKTLKGWSKDVETSRHAPPGWSTEKLVKQVPWWVKNPSRLSLDDPNPYESIDELVIEQFLNGGPAPAKSGPLVVGMNQDLVIKEVPGKGRGLFALKPIKAGEIIDRNPVAVFGNDKLRMPRYHFAWRDGKSSAVVLGSITIINHSYEPNAYYWRDYKNKEMVEIALRDIAKGEEITHNYNGNPSNMVKVKGFSVKESTGGEGELDEAIFPGAIVAVPVLLAALANFIKREFDYRTAVKLLNIARSELTELVDVKAEMSKYPGMFVVTNEEDLANYTAKYGHRPGFLTPSSVREILKEVKTDRSTTIQPVTTIGGEVGGILISAPKLHRFTLAHEVGHVKSVIEGNPVHWQPSPQLSQLKSMFSFKYAQSPLGTYREEVRAWDLAGVPPDHPLRVQALKTYSTMPARLQSIAILFAALLAAPLLGYLANKIYRYWKAKKEKDREVKKEKDREVKKEGATGVVSESFFDPNSTENEGRHRLRQPGTVKDYFRRRGSTPGVSYVMGKDKRTGKSVTQSVRFDKSKFDEKKAAAWWRKNKRRYSQ